MAGSHGKKGGEDDCEAELKQVRKRRAELAGETSRLEEKLRDMKMREAEMQEAERAKRSLEAEKRLLMAEEKRAKELAEELKRNSWQGVSAQAKPDNRAGEARTVEIGAQAKTEELDASYPYNFLVARRFFGVDEFTKAEKRKTDVVSKTKKLVGM